MVGTKGCSGGYRPGAGRRPGSTSIKKDKRMGKAKPSEQPKSAASAKFFEEWHDKMMAHAKEDKAQRLAAAAARKAGISSL
jgi:hypothetical protein